MPSSATNTAFGHVKPILIGVTTTVIATLIITKVFNSPARETKDATISAWETTIRFENLSLGNIRKTLCEDNLENQLDGIVYEKEQLIKNYEIVKNKPNIDENFVSFLTRAIGETTEQKKIFEDYGKNYAIIKRRNDLSEDEKKPQLDSLDQYYLAKINLADTRNQDALIALHQTLVDKYGDHFKAPKEAINPQESYFIGKWKEHGIDKVFNITSDHRFTMTINSTDYTGVWNLNGQTLTLIFDDKSGSLNLYLSLINDSYFRFRMNDETEERQLCRQ